MQCLAQGWPNVHCSANATFGPLSAREAQPTCRRRVPDLTRPSRGQPERPDLLRGPLLVPNDGRLWCHARIIGRWVFTQAHQRCRRTQECLVQQGARGRLASSRNRGHGRWLRQCEHCACGGLSATWLIFWSHIHQARRASTLQLLEGASKMCTAAAQFGASPRW